PDPGPGGARGGGELARHRLRPVGAGRGGGEPAAAADRGAVAAGHGAVAAGLVRLRPAVPVDPGGDPPRNQFGAHRGGRGGLPVRPGVSRFADHLPDRERAGMSTALQYLIVALIVLPCAFYAAGVFAPQLKRRALRGA